MSAPVHIETSRDLPLVSVMVGFKIGSVLDPVGKEGLTRLMVRMLRRGAGDMGATTIENHIDRLGADLSEHAGTSTVSFQMEIIRRSFDRGIELLAKLLGSPSFDPAELGKLLRESEGEIIEARDNDRALASRAFRRTVFEDHPFARRASGLIPTLRAIERSDVLDAYARTLTRDKVVMAFAGDVDDAMAQRAAELIHAALPAGPSPARSIPDPAMKPGRRLVFVDKPERTQTQMLIGGMGTHPRDDDHVALHVANTVFGGTFTSRLMREVRSKRGWSYGAYANLPIDVCREGFSLWTHPKATDAAECLKLELKLLEEWRDKGITAAELAFAKRYLTRSHAFEIDTATKRVHRKLATSLYDLPEDYYSRYLEQVKAVTREQADAAVRNRLSGADLVVAITGTASEIGEQIKQAIPGLVEHKVVPHDLE
ncbi:MAG: insulinase family protein [Deltaproteobacteria bacterium]|nr:insulinase family protein [Deltaproteobacteria bacterium]